MTLVELQLSSNWKCLDFLGFPNNWVCRNGDVLTTNRRGTSKIEFLTPVKDKDNYLTYNLNYAGHKKNVKGHRLVALAFIANPDNLPEVDHKDGVHDHNEEDNLIWVTGKKNCLNYQHKVRQEEHDFSCNRIDAILRDYAKGLTQAQISRKYNVSATYVHRIVVKHNISKMEVYDG